MSDQYYSAIQEQWSNIRGLYMATVVKKKIYGSKGPKCLWKWTISRHLFVAA